MENPEKQKILEAFSQLLDKENLRITIIIEGGENITIGDKKAIPPEKSINNVESVYQKITDIMQNLGFTANVKGYEYLREAIKMCYDNKKLVRNITKIIYPTIAKKYDDNFANVERTMRHAIEKAWSRGNKELQTTLFGYSVDIKTSKPKNGEFIAKVADYIRINNI